MWMLLALTALAQEEICAPVPPARVESSLAEAEASLARLDAEAARATLQVAREDARCLSVVAPPALLARLAWAQAEVAAIDMDEEAVWPWIRLARLVGAESPPARVDANHPLQRVLEDEPDTPPISGPDDVQLHRPKSGQVYANGQILLEPRLMLATHHLVQVFDRDQLHLGVWQSGASFPTALLRADVQAGHRQPEVAAHPSELPPKNWKPAKLNTEAAYRDWLKKKPDGPWAQAARDGLDHLRWSAALEENTELAYKQYLHAWPEGLHVDDARFRIEDLAYRRLLGALSRAAWVGFLDEHPDGAYASEARLQIDMLDWSQARRQDDAAAYRRYLDAHPEGRNAARAREWEEERALDEARAKNTDSAMEKFLERWPDGRFAKEAHAILGAAKFEQLQILVEGEVDPSVREAVHARLAAALTERGIPLVDAASPTTATMRVSARVAPRTAQITDLHADLAVELGDLARPLTTLRISSTMLPDADPGPLIGDLLVTNLRPLDRWWTPPEEKKR